MTTSVRTAHSADLPKLVMLNKGLFAEDASVRDPFRNSDWSGQQAYFTDLVADGHRNVAWVVEVDTRVVGYLAGRLRDADDMRLTATAVLESMFVDAAARIRFYERFGLRPRAVILDMAL